MKNILVVKLSAIGDVIHALPVSYAIKETFPEAKLTWVVEPPAYPLLENNPYIDRFLRKRNLKAGRAFGKILALSAAYCSRKNTMQSWISRAFLSRQLLPI